MKNKIIRYTLNGVILAAVAAIGVAAYQIGTSPTEEKIIQEMEDTESEEYAMLEGELAEDEDLNTIGEQAGEFGEDETDLASSEETEAYEKDELSDMDIPGETETGTDGNFEVENKETINEEGFSGEDTIVTSGNADSENGELTEEVSVDSNLIDIEVPEEDWESVDTSSQSMLQQLHFSDTTQMEWPATGEILLDYNMNQTVYFPTLDQYKLSSAIAIQAEEGTPVLAAASGMIYDIVQNAQTGTTVTMELGDGYQAIYGQLKDLTVEEGEMIEKGTVIGYINAPTKYYSVEGSNLYFSMKRNGEYIDPTAYLPE